MSVGGNQDSGYSSIRGILKGSSDIGNEISDMRGTTPLPHFPIVVVIDVYYDPVGLSEEDKANIKQICGTPELVDRMPRNAILGRSVSRESDKSDSTPRLFFPANVYDGQPVKPGEQVFVFYSDPYKSTHIGYWWCRVPEPMDTDDVNFTHADRKFEYDIGLSTAERAEGGEPPPPGFMNGTGTEDSTTLAGDVLAYDEVNKNALANSVIIKEPVARFTKRPGDRVIQGSNGTRIVLGTDRTGPAADAVLEGTPTIDIVATDHTLPSDNGDPEGSAPRVITNLRGEKEVDKNPKKKNKKDNLKEGDPDFENDKARIYISANTDADGNFEISINGVPASDGGLPAIVIKADQVRLVAKSDCKISIGEDGAGVVLQGNDLIFIPSDSGVIKLGGADADKALLVGAGTNAGGIVISPPLVSTMGGAVGIGNTTQGFFATKVLVK